jgi:serine/threonine protein kinase
MISPGSVLQGRYKVMNSLGSGGFSIVYLAEDLRLAGRYVAVKENQDTSPAAMRAFTQEAELLARLQHPNLPRVTDHFTEAMGYQYLVMDYVAGENLDDLVKRQGRLDEATALAMLREVMEAVAYLHQQQPPIIHRDIKPSNLIRRQLDGRILLVDFGIAKQQVAGGGTLTAARAVTPGFAPPEQYYGRTDARSDVYSLGATLYYLLTGVVPPEAPARSSGYESLTPPRRIDARISAGVETAILCAMDLDAARRFSAVELLASALLGGGWAVTQPVRPSGGSARSGRWRLAAAGLGLVIVAFLAGILITRQPNDAELVSEARVTVLARAETSLTGTSLAAPEGVTSDTPVAAAVDTPTMAALATPTEVSAIAPTATPGPESTLPPSTEAVLPTSTPVLPTPTDLPPPTSTAVPPTPTAALVERALPVSMARVANDSTEEGYGAPPLGAVLLGGVPFELPSGRNSVTTQAEPLPTNPTFVVAEMQVERPQRVYLLLTGGNLYAEYMNRPLGLVRLRFATGSVQEERLVAGYNLREWKIYDQVTVATTSAPNVREVWRTGSRHGGTGVIDMLTIEVAPENRGSTLVAVEMVDTSVQNIGSMDPAINWLGLTAVGLGPGD